MKIKSVILAMGLAFIGSQVGAKTISHPFINCDQHGALAEKIMTYKLKGASKEHMQRAMQATADTSPAYEIQAQLGFKTIEAAFDKEVPKSKKDHKQFAQVFGEEQLAWCKKTTDIEAPDDLPDAE